jgi:hypothetical protein
MVPADDGASPGPLDRAVLNHLHSRFTGRKLFDAVDLVDTGKLHLSATFAPAYYPGDTTGKLEIRWYRNDDFSIHYQETHPDEAWACRWDRHPNSHNTRDHFHPPPAASRTNADDADWPPDHRDVCQLVLDRIEARIETLWDHE